MGLGRQTLLRGDGSLKEHSVENATEVVTGDCPCGFIKVKAQAVSARGPISPSQVDGIVYFRSGEWGLVSSMAGGSSARIMLARACTHTGSASMLLYFVWKKVVKTEAMPAGDV